MSIYALIAPEVYSVSPNLNTGLNYVLFNNGPFYLNTLTVSFTPVGSGSSVNLALGTDYAPVLLFNAATAGLGLPVYGGIGLINANLVGLLHVQYAPLGLGYSITQAQINAIQANNTIDPYDSTWETTVPNYQAFPQLPLAINTSTPFTMDAVNARINYLSSSIGGIPPANSVFNLNNHNSSNNNPHLENPQALGVGNVPNWGVAVSSDIVSKVTNKFVTPASIAGAVNVIAPKATTTFNGVVELNVGASAADGSDSTKVLTAAGLATLLANGNLNTNNITNNQQVVVKFNPFPIPWPFTWNGAVCNNFSDLVAQVQLATGISPITACAKTGQFWFPNGFSLSGYTGI